MQKYSAGAGGKVVPRSEKVFRRGKLAKILHSEPEKIRYLK